MLVVGSDALREQIDAAGLTPVDDAGSAPVAVVQGYGPEVGWRQLAEATVAIRGGALWVATNTDRTLPSPRGPLPGNGAMVAALSTALDRTPDVVVGKPEPALFVEAAARVGAHRPLVVGDRLDTDVEGAHRAGMDSVLVLTGVASPRDAFDRATAAPADPARVRPRPNCPQWTTLPAGGRYAARRTRWCCPATVPPSKRCDACAPRRGAARNPHGPYRTGTPPELVLRDLNLARPDRGITYRMAVPVPCQEHTLDGVEVTRW